MSAAATPTTAEGRLDYSLHDLLADGACAEPLFANGVRCHGGYVSGEYVEWLGLWWDRYLQAGQQTCSA